MKPIKIDGDTIVYGIIGNPVRHSFSPAMQTTAFQESDINAVYLPFHILPEELPDVLSAFDIMKVRGFNVTIPYKQRIIPYLDSISKNASVLQSVNTVIRTENGWEGHSTDGAGFINSLANDKVAIDGAKVVVYGAGGSCRAITHALAERKIASLTIINRTKEKADKIVSEITELYPNLKTGTNTRHDEHVDILVNTTSVGMDDHECPVPDVLIDNCEYVIDIIYSPRETTLLKKAAERGIRNQNGIEMLLQQGAVSFELWSGQQAPTGVMRKSLINSLS